MVAEHVGGGFGAKQNLTLETVAAIELARAASAPVAGRPRPRRGDQRRGLPPQRRDRARAARERLGAARARSRCAPTGTPASAWARRSRASAGWSTRRAPRTSKTTTSSTTCRRACPSGARARRWPAGRSSRRSTRRRTGSGATRSRCGGAGIRSRSASGSTRWVAVASALARPRRDAVRDRDASGAASAWPRRTGSTSTSWAARSRWASSADGCSWRTGVQDIGTGSRSVLASTVAGAFDLEPAAVEVRIGDSRLSSGPSIGRQHGHGDARPDRRSRRPTELRRRLPRASGPAEASRRPSTGRS